MGSKYAHAFNFYMLVFSHLHVFKYHGNINIYLKFLILAKIHTPTLYNKTQTFQCSRRSRNATPPPHLKINKSCVRPSLLPAGVSEWWPRRIRLSSSIPVAASDSFVNVVERAESDKSPLRRFRLGKWFPGRLSLIVSEPDSCDGWSCEVKNKQLIAILKRIPRRCVDLI